MSRGNLRIFLGAAPGAGKTFAMLDEGRRLAAEGTEVVVGAADVRGREEAANLLQGLERCPPQDPEKGPEPALDVDALLSRSPGVVLVDDFAACDAGVARWQQIERLLEAGIGVISTLDIRNLESLSDVMQDITGVRETATVPDSAVRGADQIELVDASPELLRQRLGEGKIYSSRQEQDAALAGGFRPGTLAALREHALLWLAGQVDSGLSSYRALANNPDSRPTRERIVVGISGKAQDEALIRRAARMLAAAAGGELHVVHVRTAAAGPVPSGKDLDLLRTAARGVGGVFHAIGGEDVPIALLQFARSVNASQLVLGTPRLRPAAMLPWLPGPRRSDGRTVAAVVRNAGNLDIHLVAGKAGEPERARPGTGLVRSRQLPAFALAVVLPLALQFVLGQLPHNELSTDMLLQLTGVVAVALLGGLWPGLVAAVLAGLTVNYFSVRPVGTFIVIDPEHVLALLIFVLVAVAVSLVVDRSARLSKEARRAGAEASVLGELSRRAVAEGTSIPAFLDHVREHFQVAGAGLWVRERAGERTGNPFRRADGWVLREYSGETPVAAASAETASTRTASTRTAGTEAAGTEAASTETAEQLDGDRMLTLTGRELSADERRLLAAFGAHLLAMLQREELSASQRENLRLSEGNKMRTSILRAVSHDLRTPLAGIKLAASSLRDRTISFSPAEEEELLATIESGADRLDRLVSNLLDMSRITADAVSPLIRPVHWADAVGEALRGLDSERLRLLLPDNMPPVDADPGMLERVVANLVENALKYAPDSDVVISGSVGGAGSARIGDAPASELTVVDHGRGIPAEDVLAMFRPFQRADDTNPGTGIGLGLAVAKGFTEAMGGVLLAEPTPGGGLTMVVRLPLSTGVVPDRHQEPGTRGRYGRSTDR